MNKRKIIKMKYFEERNHKIECFLYENEDIDINIEKSKKIKVDNKNFHLKKNGKNIYINIEKIKYNKRLYMYFNDILIEEHNDYTEWIIFKRDIINGRHPVIIVHLSNKFKCNVYYFDKNKNVRTNYYDNFLRFDKDFENKLYNNIYRTKSGLFLKF